MHFSKTSRVHPLLLQSNQVKVQVIIHGDCPRCKAQLRRMGIHILKEFPIIDCFLALVHVRDLRKISECRFIRFVEPDSVVKIKLNVATPTIGARTAKEIDITGNTGTLAIADTGIYPHTDFILPRNRIIHFEDIVGGKTVPYDDNGHGTAVAGAAMGSGFASAGRYQGVARGARVIAIKVMDAEGVGTASNILHGMQWVADHQKQYDIKVFSMSLGAPALQIARWDALARGAIALWQRGIVVVTAAGNEGPAPNTINTPGIAKEVITVGAADDKRTLTQADDTLAPFSSRGPAGDVSKPDLVAPGVRLICPAIPAAGNPDGYAPISGTSIATPLVSGACMMLRECYPSQDPDGIKHLLMQNTFPLAGDINEVGAGEINIGKML